MRRWLTYDRLVVATKPKTRDSPLVMMFALATALFAHTSPASHQNLDMGKLNMRLQLGMEGSCRNLQRTCGVLAEENYRLLVCQ